eukprot:scaffold38823_cov60-Phaeocystis_antarctica.AAC.2
MPPSTWRNDVRPPRLSKQSVCEAERGLPLQVSCYGKKVQVAPCCRCTVMSEQPGTSTWWGKGRYKYMNGKTTEKEPPEPPGQRYDDAYSDSDEEEKLEKKLDAKPVPVMPLGPAPSSSCEGSAASSPAMPVVMDLTGDD